jgi:SAM-dependent methyltransferase
MEDGSISENKEHWTASARAHGQALAATTKTWTAKSLELDAFTRRLRTLMGDGAGQVLEMGCGNGVNCVALAERFPALSFDGVDFVPEMIDAAKEVARGSTGADRLRFFVGDAIGVSDVDGLADEYDVVFTDRCLINLQSTELQKQGISALAGKVRPGGHLLMIENNSTTHGLQNHYRTLLGLPPRPPASFNHFFDVAAILPHIEAVGLELVDVEDFISLHDLVLYVLVPAVNGGEVDYGHPMVEAATELTRAVNAETPGAFGASGQNRLYCCRRPA